MSTLLSFDISVILSVKWGQYCLPSRFIRYSLECQEMLSRNRRDDSLPFTDEAPIPTSLRENRLDFRLLPRLMFFPIVQSLPSDSRISKSWHPVSTHSTWVIPWISEVGILEPA